MMMLDDVEKRVLEASLPLEEDALNLVFGRGSSEASVFLVGEAPGEEEDKKGEPFVGRSGSVLSEVLEEAGIDEGRDVYIANVVKYRPPGNRDPRVDEVKAHGPYLLEQIRAVDPDVVVPLGNTATEFFFEEGQVFSGISQERGESFEVDIEAESYPVFPTYHPAATLYNRSLRDDFVTDLESVKNQFVE